MRLIDADAATDMFQRLSYDDWNQGAQTTWAEAFSTAAELVENVPTVDAVEVIRCKDCKWFNDFGCAIRIIDDTDKPKETDFCSFAERRQDEKFH